MKHAKFVRLLALVMVLSMLVLTACSGGGNGGNTSSGSPSGSNSQSQSGSSGNKVLTMAIQSTWDSMAPMDTTSNYGDILFDQIYDKLFVNSFDGKAEPRLAKSYETAPDKSYIIFHLDEKAKWHDGQPVTAKDVVFSMQVNTNPDVQSRRRNFFKYFKGTDDSGAETGPKSVAVEAVDEHTVKMTYKEPMEETAILNMFNRYFYVLPEHLLGSKTPAELSAPDTWAKPIGSGPCIYESEITGESMTFKANKDYYLGAPDFDRLIIRVVPTANLLAGLVAGDIDMIGGAGVASIPLSDWDAAQKEADLVTKSEPAYAYQAMTINTQKPYLTQEVRQAINYAINRKVIVDQLIMGEAALLYSPYPEYHPFYNKDLEIPEYNPEKAKEMLKAAGWDESRTLLMGVPTGNKIREQSAPLIQQDLAAVGIKVEIQQFDFPTLLNMLKNGETDFGLMGSAGSIDPDEISGWLDPTTATNFSCMKDTTIADTLKSALHKTTFEERKPLYDKAQELILEQAPILYMYSQNVLMAHSKRVTNVDTSYFGQINWKIWEWKVA